jgi:ankyrin repeat protein
MEAISFLDRLSHFPIFRLAIVMLIALACSTSAFCGEIHEAARAGDLAKVMALLKDDPELVSSEDNGGKTPLHWAVRNGNMSREVIA